MVTERMQMGLMMTVSRSAARVGREQGSGASNGTVAIVIIFNIAIIGIFRGCKHPSPDRHGCKQEVDDKSRNQKRPAHQPRGFVREIDDGRSYSGQDEDQ